MKEDIKNLEEIINLSKEEIEKNDENITAILDLEDLKSLKNLLTRYKQLEEENKKLIAQKTAINNKRKELEEELERFRTGKYISLKVNELYIPKSKVKEILNKNCVTFFEGDAEFPDDANRIVKKKYIKAEVLQELLREE